LGFQFAVEGLRGLRRARLFQRGDILVGEVLERKVAPVGWPV
jgi:hypothetical protein